MASMAGVSFYPPGMGSPSLKTSYCEWLAPEGPYRELARSLSAADPRLQHRDFESEKREIVWPSGKPRALILHQQNDGGFTEPSTYTDAEALRQILQNRQTPTPRCRTVVILEGLSPDFIEVLGVYYNIHPTMFVEHERSHHSKVLPRLEPTSLLALPASGCTRDYVGLNYVELVRLPQLGEGQFNVHCTATYRHVGVTRTYGEFHDVGMARRKCTVWHRQHAEVDSWDCLILCDPPIESIRIFDGGIQEQVSMPQPSFPCGYLDFTPLEHQMERKSGPPRTSMAADLTFYLRSVAPLLDLRNPACVTMLAAKIAASHFLMHAGYLREIMSAVESKASNLAHLAGFHIAEAEAQWSDAQTLCRRMHEYIGYLEANMLQLRIPFAEPDTSRVVGWDDVSADFQYLALRFRDLRLRAEMISHSRAGLASIAGNRQGFREQQLALQAAERSIREARSARALTFVGLVFIPLAYTASLFSMADPYAPGKEGFWVYFAISVPLIIFVISAYYLLNLGYSLDGSTWSAENVWRRIASGAFEHLSKTSLDKKLP